MVDSFGPYFFKTISDAPLVKSRKHPCLRQITVLIDFRTELNV